MFKSVSFFAGEGSSFFVPFGFAPSMVAVSEEFVMTVLTGDTKAKEALQKVHKPADRIATYVMHPLFDATHDIAQPSDVKSVAAYTWAQAATWIPSNWKQCAEVKAYWASLPGQPATAQAENVVAEVEADKPAAP